jgi:hypothetical protein
VTAPASEICAVTPEDGAIPKEGKRQRKLLRERHRPLDPREQGRHLWEAVNQARRLIELADHKARYALVVMGVVNAGVFVLATRSEHFVQLVPDTLRALFSFLIFPFGLMTVVFLVDAYNSLRPRAPALSSDMDLPRDWESRPVGLVFWGTLLTHSLEHYQRAWETVHRGQLNNELAAMAYTLAGSVQAKYRALHRLYIELLIIILLAAVLLAVPMFAGFFSNGPSVIPRP